MADMQWNNIEPTPAEVKAYGEIKAQEKALAAVIFKRAGGKGEPSRHSFKHLASKGVGFPADDFKAGNVKEAKVVAPVLTPAQVKAIAGWIKAIEGGDYTIEEVKAALASHPVVLHGVLQSVGGEAPMPKVKATIPTPKGKGKAA